MALGHGDPTERRDGGRSDAPASETIVVAMSRLRLAAAVCAAAASLVCVPATAHAAAQRPTVLLAFYPLSDKPPEDPALPETPILDRLDQRPELSLGLLGATQGRYDPFQALLDLTQGTRVSRAAYNPDKEPPLALYPQGKGGLIQGWLDARARAESAPADIVPGLLGQSVPGGIAYAGLTTGDNVEAVVAADRTGRIGRVSLGDSASLPLRAQRLLDDHQVVAAGLPTGDKGAEVLGELLEKRRPGELVIVIQSPPPRRAPQLLPVGVLGMGKPSSITSDTTRRTGLVAGIDVMPTVLDHIGVKVPKEVKGEPIRLEGKRDADMLRDLDDRLRVVGPRRFPALETLLATWLAITFLLGLLQDRRGIRTSLRLGALAFMWVLPMLLVTAALAPSRTAELAILAGGTFLLAVITDRLVPWPRAPMVPAAVTVVSYVVDLALGSDLIIRSLLGSNPRFGSRYFGIGNELEAAIPVLMFIGLAALMAHEGRSRRGAAIFAGCGLLLGAAVGSGRLGADVGGVITIGAGTAVATLLMLPGGVTKRGIAIAIVAPVLALVALAGLDLATGGNGHFTRTVLHAEGEGAIQDIVLRRYELAFNVLKRGFMPFATAIAILAILYGLKYRSRILGPLRGSPAWDAALGGSLACALAGALANDSGPLLLLIAAFVLLIAVSYVRGDPALARDPLDDPGYR
jgi:hypothetical protein